MENLPKPENDTPVQDATGTDNSTHDEFENVANPMRPGSEDESGDPAQDGRNLRALGSTDQDSANGLLRMNDQDNSTMEVTPEADKSIVSPSDGTHTSGGAVTLTTAGPDDDASADETPAPDAEKPAKEAQEDGRTADGDAPDSEGDKDDEIARTGTDFDFTPAA